MYEKRKRHTELVIQLPFPPSCILVPTGFFYREVALLLWFSTVEPVSCVAQAPSAAYVSHPTPLPFRNRSNLDHAMPGYCRPLVLVINGLSFAAGLLVRGMSDTPVEDKATRATVGAAASLVFLAVAVVTLAVVAYCPELPNPHGGPQVRRSLSRKRDGAVKTGSPGRFLTV